MRPQPARPTPTAPEGPSPRPLLSRLPAWAWIAIGIAGLVLVVLLARLVAVASLVVLITGIVSLVRHTPTWLRLPSRRAAIIVTTTAAIVLVMTSAIASATQQHSEKPTADAPLGLVAPAASTSASAVITARSATPTPEPTPVVVVSEVTATEPIAFTESVVEDNTIPQGETRVLTVGQNGEVTVTYRVTTVDGVETERVEVSRATTLEPIAQVVANGTYVPPQTFVGGIEEASSAECDPNYADACVPVASDVDCAWGSGNGPAYLDGVARVVGSDIYDLDRDGDGWACERD